ncbi:MAG: hypothetical protein J7K04_00525 [Spirochaetales bacterium]|nr:hypothetical protein [Spirochaetales bacterium]
MISGFLLQLGNSFKIILAVVGLASMYPEVEVDNVSIYRDNNSIFVQFDTESILNNSIMHIIDSEVDVDFSYLVTTTVNGKTVYSRNYIERVSAAQSRYRVNRGELLTFEGLIKRMKHHEYKIYEDLTNPGAVKAKTVIKFSLSCRETPDLLKLWGNKPGITINYALR